MLLVGCLSVWAAKQKQTAKTMSSDSQTTAARDLQNILASHDSKDPEVKQLESMANNFTSTPTQKKTYACLVN